MTAEFKLEDLLTEEEKLVMYAASKGKLDSITGNANKMLGYAKNKKMENVSKFKGDGK